jgi:RND family efflux transporter MFP subunit
MLNLWKNKTVRNWTIAGVAVIAALLLAWGFSPAKANDTTVATGATVASLDVAETIEASGSLEAQPFASLSWKTSGVVEAVNVKPGDFVKADTILLTLDPTSTSASIVSAQADLVTAQKNLEDLLTSGTDLAQAAIDLKNAQEDYDDAVYYLRYLQTDTKVPQTAYGAKLEQTNSGWKYKYTAENFKGPAPKDWIIEAENDLALKKAELEDAQREYDRLLAGDNSADVIAAQAEVDAAQATVNSLSIIAPFDAEVLSVDNHVGDVVDTGELSVNLADMDHLYVETQVDESDIANVKLGNQAEVTLDAVPGVTLTGEVTTINPVGEVDSGLVKYKVRVELDKVDGEIFLPLGTTANVIITVKEAAATLTVPITTIQNDAQGEFVWIIQSDGSTKRVDVVSGSIVGDQVVVTGDLQDGDRIQLVQTSGFEAPNPFGGGN